jgi:hypothetical protein
VSFHQIAVRPTARLADARLLFTDGRAAARAHAGLRHLSTIVCGVRRNGGTTMPPSPVDRAAVAFWESLDDYRAFHSGPIFDRWTRAGSVYSVLLEPFAARGTWEGRDLLPVQRRHEQVEGPVAVLTWSRVPLHLYPAWYGHITMVVGPHISRSPGLIACSSGAALSLRRLFTMTFWESNRAMLDAAYGTGTRHLGRVKWGKEHLEPSFARFQIMEHHGEWEGRDPLADFTR